MPIRVNYFRNKIAHNRNSGSCRNSSQQSLSMSKRVKLKTRFKPHKRCRSLNISFKKNKKLIKKTKKCQALKQNHFKIKKKAYRRKRRTKSFVCTSLKELQNRSRLNKKKCVMRQSVRTEASSILETSTRTSLCQTTILTNKENFSQKIRKNSQRRKLLQKKVKEILSTKMKSCVKRKKQIVFQNDEEVINYAMNLVAEDSWKENIIQQKNHFKDTKTLDKDMSMIEKCLSLLKNDEVKKLQIISKMRNF